MLMLWEKNLQSPYIMILIFLYIVKQTYPHLALLCTTANSVKTRVKTREITISNYIIRIFFDYRMSVDYSLPTPLLYFFFFRRVSATPSTARKISIGVTNTTVFD